MIPAVQSDFYKTFYEGEMRRITIERWKAGWKKEEKLEGLMKKGNKIGKINEKRTRDWTERKRD